MKKKLLFMTLIMSVSLLLSGCGSKSEKEVDLDLDKISSSLETLKSDNFDRFLAEEILDSNMNSENLEFIYDFDLEKNFGFVLDNLEDYTIKYDSKTKEMYFIMKPFDNPVVTENTVSNYLDVNKLNYEKANYGKYIVFVVSKNAKELVSKLQDCKENIFGMMMDVDGEMFEQQFNLKDSDVEEYLVKIPTVLTQSSTIVVVKPAAGKKNEVKSAMKTYFEALEEQWSMYLPDQYELVKNRLETEYGGYLIYIVSSNNNLALDLIKAN